MWTCQVNGHHDKMARTQTNTQNNTKARKTRNSKGKMRKVSFDVGVIFMN